MKRTLLAIAIGAYLSGAIMAFGHSAAQASRACIEPRVEFGGGQTIRTCFTDVIVGGALFAGAFWPLYVSWIYFEGGDA